MCESSEAFEEFSLKDVSLSSVGVLGEVFPSDSDCELVKPQFSCFTRKRRSFHMESKEDECGEVGRRSAAVVKKEHTRSGL